MIPNDEDILNNIFHKDEYFKKFLGPLATAQQVASHSLTVAEQINKLAEGIVSIDKEIQRQVLENHEDLLSQATWIEKLEGVLEMMALHVQSLMAGLERLQSRISEPFKKIETENLVLRRVWSTIDLLRRISRIQVVSRRLTNQLRADPNDLIKLSDNIRDLSELWSETDMSKIEVLEPDLQNLKSARRDVGKRAKNMLILGLQGQKQSQVLQSVEILFNLDTLVTVVGEITNSARDSLEQIMKESLDVRSLIQTAPEGARKQAPVTPGPTAAFRPRLWSTLEKVFDAIYVQCTQIECLEMALRAPRGDIIASSIPLFIDVFPVEKRNIASLFWKAVTGSLADCLVKTAGQSSFIKQALEGEYPKFLRLYIDLCKRLQSTEKSENFTSPFEINKQVIAVFEKSYLSKSVSMVLDPVHNMFSKEGVPDTEEVDLLIRTIRSELSVALFDPNLSSTIARNITKAVRLFCSNCDNLVDLGPDATQVIGPRKSVQDKNIAVANITEYLKSKLKSVMSNLNTTTDATMIVSLSLIDADNLITNILNPVLVAIEKAINAILLTMHNEDFSKDTVSAKVSTSLYMRELQEFIGRAHNTYLKPFDSEEVVKKCACNTGKRCVELFMRHVSVIRPLGAHGRAKLIADCNQLESAVAPLLSDEPKTYRILRSFRSLLSQTPEEILKNPAVGETIPVSLTLFYLFSFAPEEMKSPHQSGVNWTVEELSAWLDAHESERDRLGLISGTLGRYCNHIRQQPGKNFDSVYGVMAELIQRSGSTALK